MSWLLLIVGAVFAVLPGVVDPFAPVNGLTLLGVVTMFGGVLFAVRAQ